MHAPGHSMNPFCLISGPPPGSARHAPGSTASSPRQRSKMFWSIPGSATKLRIPKSNMRFGPHPTRCCSSAIQRDTGTWPIRPKFTDECWSRSWRSAFGSSNTTAAFPRFSLHSFPPNYPSCQAIPILASRFVIIARMTKRSVQSTVPSSTLATKSKPRHRAVGSYTASDLTVKTTAGLPLRKAPQGIKRSTSYLQSRPYRSNRAAAKGVTIDHHNLSHHGKDPAKIAQLRLIEEAELAVVRDLLGKLKTKQEQGVAASGQNDGPFRQQPGQCECARHAQSPHRAGRRWFQAWPACGIRPRQEQPALQPVCHDAPATRRGNRCLRLEYGDADGLLISAASPSRSLT